MIKTNDFEFRPLKKDDLKIIECWLKKPHVKEFWNSGSNWEETYKKYILRISSDVIEQFIVYYQEKQIGYIQFYWASQVGDGWWEDYPRDVIGIDQYIGDPNYINKGYGTEMIKAFIKSLKKDHKFSKIITDPSPNNLRAIRCYEKVGFVKKKKIITPYGDALLMEYDTELKHDKFY